jgi:hypothetical protein
VRSEANRPSNSAIAPRIWKNIQPPRAGGVNVLIQHHQITPLVLQPFGQLDQVLQRAPEPIEPGNDDLILWVPDTRHGR